MWVRKEWLTVRLVWLGSGSSYVGTNVRAFVEFVCVTVYLCISCLTFMMQLVYVGNSGSLWWVITCLPGLVVFVK